MSAQVACPICKTKYTVADDLVGRTIPCKKCQESFVARPVADDIPVVEAVADDVRAVAAGEDVGDETPTVLAGRPAAPAGRPVLFFLVGAGAAVTLLGVVGLAAYLLWPEEPTPTPVV